MLVVNKFHSFWRHVEDYIVLYFWSWLFRMHMCVCCAGETSVSLQVTQVPLLSGRECRRQGLTSWNICTRYLEGGAGTCQVLHLCVIIINYNSHYWNKYTWMYLHLSLIPILLSVGRWRRAAGLSGVWVDIGGDSQPGWELWAKKQTRRLHQHSWSYHMDSATDGGKEKFFSKKTTKKNYLQNV